MSRTEPEWRCYSCMGYGRFHEEADSADDMETWEWTCETCDGKGTVASYEECLSVCRAWWNACSERQDELCNDWCSE